jgi:hypothetical protein
MRKCGDLAKDILNKPIKTREEIDGSFDELDVAQTKVKARTRRLGSVRRLVRPILCAITW